MIEIYLGGSIYYESNMAIDDFYKLIMDNFINPDTFIEIPLSRFLYRMVVLHISRKQR